MISPKGRKELLAYKYKGSDLSLLYKYFFNPFAQFCVDYFVPPHVAPNVITALGFVCSILMAGITLVFDPLLIGEGPRWLPLLCCLSLFLYQTLDNMDGKQARKTQSSSPLGLLFDHGCDSMNTFVMVIPMCSMWGTGWTMGMFLPLWCGMVPFYFQTWEEFHVGELVLPIFNGPDEGLCLGMAACVISYVKGTAWWWKKIEIIQPLNIILSFLKEYHIFTAQQLDFMYSHFGYVVFLAFALVAGTCIMCVIKVLAFQIESKGSVTSALMGLVPFFAFFPCAFMYCLHSTIAIPAYPLMTLLLLGSTLVESVTHIMLMHITNDDLRPLQRISSILFPLLPLNIFASSSGPIVDETLLLGIFALGATIHTTWNIVTMFQEVADALGIYFFVMGKRKEG